MRLTYPDPGLTHYISFLIESAVDRHCVPPDILLAALFQRIAFHTKDMSDDEFEEELNKLRRIRAIKIETTRLRSSSGAQ